jgi:hypothetical protein
MAMPVQLARANRSRHSEPRPVVEQLAYININDLRQAIPRNYGTNIYSNPFRYPQVRPHLQLPRPLDHPSHSITCQYDSMLSFGV